VPAWRFRAASGADAVEAPSFSAGTAICSASFLGRDKDTIPFMTQMTACAALGGFHGHSRIHGSGDRERPIVVPDRE